MNEPLFDPAPYVSGRERPIRKTRPAVVVVPVVIDDVWSVAVVGQRGVIHAKRSPVGAEGGWATYCGKLGASLTFDRGVKAAGCPTCLAKAPAQKANVPRPEAEARPKESNGLSLPDSPNVSVSSDRGGRHESA